VQDSKAKQKIVQFSSEALQRIEDEGLVPVPQNYELWYAYYAATSVDVVRAIDVLVSNKTKITYETCAELHHRFLSQSKSDEYVREAGQRVQDTISDMTGRVSGAKSMASQYNHALQEATETLGSDANPADIRKTLDAVIDNTQSMIKHNVALEEQLERSSAMMETLQHDLEVVRKQALTDGLTNLANRKAFDDEIKRIVATAEADGQTFTLVLLDIDHFKSFNDNYGHHVGDQVLRLVAKTLIDGVKGRDVAARYGGEEFAIILPETNLHGGSNVAESLRKIIQAKELVNRNTGDVLGRITLSAGVAEYAKGESLDDLIERTDSALYTAKHNGRNQIANAPAPKKA
jgi:diguanylate cyclase